MEQLCKIINCKTSKFSRFSKTYKKFSSDLFFPAMLNELKSIKTFFHFESNKTTSLFLSIFVLHCWELFFKANLILFYNFQTMKSCGERNEKQERKKKFQIKESLYANKRKSGSNCLKRLFCQLPLENIKQFH